MKKKAHPYAELFPMMTSTELEALAEDIKENGLRTPIVLYGGAVLDGRNRLLACEKAGVEPAFTEYAGDEASALALVISLNVQRRDLVAAQRAIVAARTMERYPERRGRPVKSGINDTTLRGRSRDVAAREFKVGSIQVEQARAILAEAPDLAARVEVCSVSLAAAYDELQNRRAKAKQSERDAKRIAKYRDAVSNGEMTMDEAMQKVLEDEREEQEKQASEADARREWLKGLAEAVDWVERFVGKVDDDYLAWYGQPDSPGMFDHGITAERVKDAAAHLERIASVTFGERNESKQRGTKKGSRAAG